MMRLLFLLVLFISNYANVFAQVKCSRNVILMGGKFNIVIVANDSLNAERYIDTVINEISRIEYLISDWIDTTQVSLVNKNAGIKPVKVSKELIDLTERAIYISQITNGAFDISFAAMEKIWKFDGSMTQMPSVETIEIARRHVGYKKIIVNRDSSTLFLLEKGMKIGFGALGEGYAADKCKNMMLAKGVKSGLINATGDIQAWGQPSKKTNWKVGINDPFKNNEFIEVLPIVGAITTSGSYEKFALINGKRYSHIINPATGYPATGLISVTVKGPEAEIANALSTSIMVLGANEGLQLIKKFPQYSCLLITDNGKRITSKGFLKK